MKSKSIFFIIVLLFSSQFAKSQNLAEIKSVIESSLRANMTFQIQWSRSNTHQERAKLKGSLADQGYVCPPTADIYIQNTLQIDDAKNSGSVIIVKGKIKTQSYLKENEIDVCNGDGSPDAPKNHYVYAEMKKVLNSYEVVKLSYSMILITPSDHPEFEKKWEENAWKNLSKFEGVVPYLVPFYD